MIGDRAREEQLVIANSITKKPSPRLYVDITTKALSQYADPILDRDIFLTTGDYSIRFEPYTKNGEKADRKFLVRCDLIKSSTSRFKSWREFVMLSQKDPILKWIIDNTMISEGLFNIAQNESPTRIPFTINVEKYYNNIKEDVRGRYVFRPNEDKEGKPR